MSSAVTVRSVTSADTPFIFETWLNSWRKSPWAGCIPNNLYYPLQRTAIEQIVGRGAEIKVACRAADPSHILGWVCSEVDRSGICVLHYLYVKEAYLPFAIGEKLVESCAGTKPGIYTYRYRQVSDACDFQKGWRHVPEAARRK